MLTPKTAQVMPGPDRRRLAGCLRERYDAGASIVTLTRNLGGWHMVHNLLIEAETDFRPNDGYHGRQFAARPPAEVLAEMVLAGTGQGDHCPCLLHSKDPWQLLFEFLDERKARRRAW